MRGIRLLSTSVLAIYTLFGGEAASGESIFDAQPLDDAELAQARGGFALPNGMTIDFGVMVTTIVDGVRVLETQLRVAGDSVRTSVAQTVGAQVDAAVSASGGGAGAQGGSQTATTDSGAVPTPPAVTPPSTSSNSNSGIVDNLGSTTAEGGIGNQVISALPGGGVKVNLGGVSISTGADGAPQINVNQATVDSSTTGTVANAGSGNGSSSTILPASGPGVTSPVPPLINGAGKPAANTLNASVLLPQLLIEHEIGRQISSLIINSGDGRVIENHLSIDVNIGNAQPFSLGSAGFQVQSLGLEAAMWRGAGG
ncbi:MAG: hypothetical protein AB7E05_01775 [Sphingobium sp.]